MPVVTIDGSDFVAIISIPALDLEFAVRNEWSKPGLKQSPCRYVGSVYTDDLIICAHNYTAHFGRLKELKQGDQIILVDMLITSRKSTSSIFPAWSAPATI